MLSPKTVMSVSTPVDLIKTMDQLAKGFGTSRSVINTLLLNVALTYFTEDQLRMELDMMGELDGRRARRGV